MSIYPIIFNLLQFLSQISPYRYKCLYHCSLHGNRSLQDLAYAFATSQYRLSPEAEPCHWFRSSPSEGPPHFPSPPAFRPSPCLLPCTRRGMPSYGTSYRTSALSSPSRGRQWRCSLTGIPTSGRYRVPDRERSPQAGSWCRPEKIFWLLRLILTFWWTHFTIYFINTYTHMHLLLIFWF